MSDPLRAYLVESRETIAPFGDRPGECQVGNRSLFEAMRECLRDAAGITEIIRIPDEAALPPGGPYLVLAEDLFLSKSLLRAFLAEARARGGGRLALKDSRTLAETRPLQELLEVPGGAAFPCRLFLGDRARSEAPVLIDPQERVEAIEGVPRALAREGRMTFAVTARSAIRLQHWVHILRANHLALVAGAAAVGEWPAWKRALGKLALAVLAFPPTEARVMRRLVRKGRGCKIHPTAVVEASLLGDGVEIGALSVVRGSVLAAGAHVEPGSFVEMSMVGEKAVIDRHTVCRFCVLYPGAFLGNGLHQMCLFGREAFVASFARFYDMKFEGEIQVEHKGKLASVGGGFLGCAIGHQARIGAGIYVQHGRAIANGTRLVRDPAEVVSRFESPGPDGILIAKDGAARAR